MDVFALTPEMHAFFASAAHKAWRALQANPPATRRMELLREALALAPKDPGVPVPDEGWGLLAEVIRRDEPLALSSRAFHEHLDQAGAEPARLLAEKMIHWGTTLLDLGGGLGTYSRAFVERGGQALVIERDEVVERAQEGERAEDGYRAQGGERARPGVEFQAGDIFAVEKSGFDLVLLCNVLHLYGAAECARLCARAKQMGKIVVVKDLDRKSAAGVWFSLNMAMFTERGEVHPADQILGWLGGGTVEQLGDHILVRS